MGHRYSRMVKWMESPVTHLELIAMSYKNIPYIIYVRRVIIWQNSPLFFVLIDREKIQDWREIEKGDTLTSTSTMQKHAKTCKKVDSKENISS